MSEFKNPAGFWSYEGPFSVHLVQQVLAAEYDGLPGFSVAGNVVSVGTTPAHLSSLKQSMGAIRCCCAGREFYFQYKQVVAFTKPDGTLIWQNRDFEGYPVVRRKLTV